MQINTNAIRNDIGTRDTLNKVNSDIEVFAKYQLERGKWTREQIETVRNASAIIQKRITR